MTETQARAAGLTETTAPSATTREVRILSSWDASRVLFTFDAPEGLESGMWIRTALEAAAESGADLSSADLSAIKTDFFDVLLRAPREIPARRAALVAGKVDGSCYEGACACLVGTIANARGADFQQLGAGLKPDSGRPIETFFMNIRPGHTPDAHQVPALCIEWLDEFIGLLNETKAVA